MSEKTSVVGGVKYEASPELSKNSCAGCVAKQGSLLCVLLGRCTLGGNGHVWRIAEDQVIKIAAPAVSLQDELLAALQRVLDCCDIAECSTVPNSPGAIKNAREAIAKAIRARGQA